MKPKIFLPSHTENSSLVLTRKQYGAYVDIPQHLLNPALVEILGNYAASTHFENEYARLDTYFKFSRFEFSDDMMLGLKFSFFELENGK